MQEHILAPYDSIQCTGAVTLFKQRFDNWNPFVNEPMTLPTALAESCDTYFYELGKRFYSLPPERGQPLQIWANRFGFGKATGLDVGSEGSGLVPTFKWKKDTFTAEIDRIWKPGDSIQLAIGQKDLQVTPLQMARFYALIANGGKLVTPHVVQAVQQGDARGRAHRAADLAPLLAAAAGDRARPGRARRRSRRPLPGHALDERHLLHHLRPLPRADRRQDRHG